MLIFLIASLAGILFTCQLEHLPNEKLSLLLCVLGLCLSSILLKVNRFGLRFGILLLTGLLLGFGWSCFQGGVYLAAQPQSGEWRLKVMDTPTQKWGETRFKAQLLCHSENFNKHGECRFNPLIAVRPPHFVEIVGSDIDDSRLMSLVPGDSFIASVSVRPRRYFANPGFDRYRWWLTERIVAEVSISALVDKPIKGSTGLSYWRYSLAKLLHFESTVEASSHSDLALFPLLNALALGDRKDLTKAHWQLFRETGTSHLVAISGLHLGLVSGWFYWLALNVCRLFPALSRYVYPNSVAALVAITVAALYGSLSGFSLPTQRAFLMLCCAFLAIAVARPKLVYNALLLALAMILLIQPFAVFTASLWLSCGAMFVVFWAVANYIDVPSGWVQKLKLAFKVQWFIFLCMVPLSLHFFDGVALNSFIANVFAIPLVTLVILPLTLLQIFSTLILSSPVMMLGDINLALLDFFLVGLQRINDLVGGYRIKSIDLCRFLLMLAGALMVCSPCSLRTKSLGALIYLVTLSAPSVQQKTAFVAYNNPHVLFELQIGEQRWLFSEAVKRTPQKQNIVAAVAPQYAQQQFYQRDLWRAKGWVMYPLHQPETAAIELCDGPLQTARFAIAPIIISGHCFVRLSFEQKSYMLMGNPDMEQQQDIAKAIRSTPSLVMLQDITGQPFSAVFLSGGRYLGAFLNGLNTLPAIIWHSNGISKAADARFSSRHIKLTQLFQTGAIRWLAQNGPEKAESLYPRRFYH